jgi:hypothetical protein
MIISRRVTNVSDKSCRENKTHIFCSVTVFQTLVVDEVMWKNTVRGAHRPQMTI